LTEIQIHKLLDELQNNEAYIRNDAIKKIIKGKIDDENIISALKNVIENDPYMSVRNFARSALNLFGVEHSAFEEPMVINAIINDKVVANKEIPDETYIPVIPLALRLIMGFYALVFIPCCFAATQAGYLFDGGDTPEMRTLFWILVSFPINILVSIAGIWGFYNAKKYTAALFIAVLPIIHFIFLLYR